MHSNNSMENFISQENSAFIERVIAFLCPKLSLSTPADALWIVFGSYVINMNTAASDVDIIVVHDSFEESTRVAFTFEDTPIHVCTITMSTLKDDGEKRLYGAYFTGKVINPHIFLYGNDESRRKALYHAGKFIAPLAGYLAENSQHTKLSASNITALTFVAYLSTDPSFDSYFLNYFLSPKFDELWKVLCIQTVEMLQTAGTLSSDSDGYNFTEAFENYQKFHSERMKIAARHWSYGAVCHNSDVTFQDFIYTKAEEKMKRMDPSGEKYQKMIEFLKRESGLSEVYV